MDSNTYSAQPPGRPPDRYPEELADLVAVLDRLAAEDPARLSDPAVADQALALRQLVDRLEGQWLRTLAVVDARGAAGAEDGLAVGSTAGWLRGRLRLAAGTAATAVRTARALFRGLLTRTAEALTSGEVSVAHAAVLAHGTPDLPTHVRVEAEPVLVEAARRLDHPAATGRRPPPAGDRPDGAAQAERRHRRRGWGWPRPWRAWRRPRPAGGCGRPDLLAALAPWPAPTTRR